MINGELLMKKNVIKDKSFELAIEVVRLYRFLSESKKEFVMSKQLLRSGTAIGALVREAEHAESKADFIHKNAIAQKETNETIYWLELLFATNYINKEQFDEMNNKTVECLKLLTSIIKSSKQNINN